MYSPPAGEGGRRKQSRIVVNVDDIEKERARARAARGGISKRLGRGGRILSLAGLLALGMLLLVALAGYLWYQSYKKRPAYSLALVVDAARRDDTETINALVDSDRVAQSLAPQVVNKAMASVGGMGTLAAPRKQIESAMPILLPGLREQMRAEIARGVKEVAAKSGDDLPFPLLALGVSRACDEIKEEGDAATVLFKVGERPIELSMQRVEERWKIVGVKDEELAANLAARVIGTITHRK
ncbi:MAG TPA: hypothetical protein VGB73_06625 [Pyrinomonadaceae bacterium]|jgi:hypothetical protein